MISFSAGELIAADSYTAHARAFFVEHASQRGAAKIFFLDC